MDVDLWAEALDACDDADGDPAGHAHLGVFGPMRATGAELRRAVVAHGPSSLVAGGAAGARRTPQ
jgi:hypothetical protein